MTIFLNQRIQELLSSSDSKVILKTNGQFYSSKDDDKQNKHQENGHNEEDKRSPLLLPTTSTNTPDSLAAALQEEEENEVVPNFFNYRKSYSSSELFDYFTLNCYRHRNPDTLARFQHDLNLNPSRTFLFSYPKTLQLKKQEGKEDPRRQEQITKEKYKTFQKRQNVAWAKELVKTGLKHLNDGDNKNAMDKFDNALRMDSDCVNALVHRGSLFFILKKYDYAICDLDKALEVDPINEIALQKRKEINKTLDDIEAHKKALEHGEFLLPINDKTRNTFDGRALNYLGPDIPMFSKTKRSFIDWKVEAETSAKKSKKKKKCNDDGKDGHSSSSGSSRYNKSKKKSKKKKKTHKSKKSKKNYSSSSSSSLSSYDKYD